jgi:hypothetical protein
MDTYLRYQEDLPFAVPRSEHSHAEIVLPQHYADELGWEDMVAHVAAIFATNYGQAGAIDFFGVAKSHIHAPELFSLGTARP